MPLSVDDHGRAKWHATQEDEQVAVRRAEAPGRRGGADGRGRVGPVDRQAIAPGPARRRVRLMPGEREDAAAVVRAEAAARDLVGHREAAGRGRRPRTPDRHRYDAYAAAADAQLEPAPGQVDDEPGVHRAPAEGAVAGVHPTEPAVAQRGIRHAGPASAPDGHRERGGRAEVGPGPDERRDAAVKARPAPANARAATRATTNPGRTMGSTWLSAGSAPPLSPQRGQIRRAKRR